MTFLYKPNQTSIPYGAIPFDQGWDADSRRNAPIADDNPGTASGFFQRSNGAVINVWLTNIAADFSVGGQSAQSRMLREFFPRNFNAVTLILTGNVASTQEYNRLASFVREHHYLAMQAINSGSVADQMLTFTLNDRTPRAWRVPASRGSDVVPRVGSPPATAQSNVKGGHLPWVVNGYIKSMQAGAVAHEVAPEFKVQFIVASTTFKAGQTGIWGDSLFTPPPLKSFVGLVKQDAVQQGTFIGAPQPIAATPPATASPPPAQAPLSTITDPLVGSLGTIDKTVWSALAGIAQSFG